MSQRPRPPLALASVLALSGCSLLHSNINSGFTCSAPRGSCAPSMTIDDAAIRAINPGPGERADETASPASNGAGSVDLVLARKAAPSGSDGPEAARAGRPALKVVYPAWRGPDGAIHPRTTSYVPVDAPPLVSPTVVPLEANRLGSPKAANLLTIAEMAPEVSALAPSPPGLRASDDTTGTVTAATATPITNNPLDAIRARVSQILSSLPKPDGLKTPAAPASQSGASFPPAGN